MQSDMARSAISLQWDEHDGARADQERLVCYPRGRAGLREGWLAAVRRIGRRTSGRMQNHRHRRRARRSKGPRKKGESAQLQRAVVIAMAVMRVMQSSVHKVVDVIAVGHGFVSAARPMRMRASGLRRAARGIGVADLDDMEVDMVPMHVVQATVVQVIDMAVVAHGGVPATRTMLVCVIRSMRLGAGGRSFAHPSLLLAG